MYSKQIPELFWYSTNLIIFHSNMLFTIKAMVRGKYISTSVRAGKLMLRTLAIKSFNIFYKISWD